MSGFTENKQNIIKCISGYVMKSMYRRFRKSTEHHSDSTIKHVSILLAGNNSLDFSTKDDKRKTIFVRLFSFHNTVSLSRHEYVCLLRLHFERYLSDHHRPDDWISISQNVASLNIPIMT